VPDESELQPLREAWETVRDGVTGTRYAEGLRGAGRLDEAVTVCREVADLGFFVGYYEWAWLEHDRGDVTRAIELMEEVAALQEDDPDRAYPIGVAGHWRWDHRNELAAEPMLRAGMDAYPEARADLAHLLMATGRRTEGVQMLADGVRAGHVECMLPLANVFSEEGDADSAEALYRRAYELGDAYSAWNLAVLMWESGRGAEAQEWVWKAAEGGDELAISYLSDVDPSDVE
jgi:tetratricopeptide (TPR) repeat protein